MEVSRSILFVFVLVLGTVGSYAAGNHCSTRNGELTEAGEALHAVHEVTSGSVQNGEEVLNIWLPRLQAVLAAGSADQEWFHLGVDLARVLDLHGRRPEARTLFSQIERLDQNSRWGKRAGRYLEIIDEGGSIAACSINR